jgi:hypothetical protein
VMIYMCKQLGWHGLAMMRVTNRSNRMISVSAGGSWSEGVMTCKNARLTKQHMLYRILHWCSSASSSCLDPLPAPIQLRRASTCAELELL